MKKIFVLSMLAAVSFSCKKDSAGEPIPYFYVYEFPAGLSPFFEYTINMPAEVAFDTSQYNSIRSNGARIVTTDGQALNFLEEVIVYIQAPGKGQLEIDYRQPVPIETGSVLDIIPSLPEIRDYVGTPGFNFKITFRARTSPAMYVPFRLDINLAGFR